MFTTRSVRLEKVVYVYYTICPFNRTVYYTIRPFKRLKVFLAEDAEAGQTADDRGEWGPADRPVLPRVEIWREIVDLLPLVSRPLFPPRIFCMYTYIIYTYIYICIYIYIYMNICICMYVCICRYVNKRLIDRAFSEWKSGGRLWTSFCWSAPHPRMCVRVCE